MLIDEQTHRRDDAATVVNMPRSHLRVGAVLRDRFVLQQVLGEGGMGKVFLAIDREVEGSNPYVAIKVLGDAFRDHPDSLSTLRREANNARQLNHPNIVGVYHFDRDGGDVFIVMEYMRGRELAEVIREHPDGLPFAAAWPLIRDCAAALGYMHAHHVVHSDFKPANVFVVEDGAAKVLDLGIARTVDEALIAEGRTRFDAAGPLALTPQYASCEMFTGARPDPRDDLYALGCVAYELLTGRHPFQRRQAIDARDRGMTAERPAGLRQRQWRALQGLLAFDRGARTGSADAFVEAFGPDQQPASTRRWRIAAASVLLMLVGLLAAGALYLREDPDERFVEQVLIEHRSRGDPSVSSDQQRLWLEQAAMNRRLGERALRDGDYPRGHYFMAEGASSASWIYRRVLATATTDEHKRAAAEGLLSLSKAYLVPAGALFDTERHDEGLAYTCEGLRINGSEAELRAWLRRYQQRDQDITRHPACARLANTMR